MSTILIIDDSAYSRHLVRQALAEEGYTLLEAANGLEALEILQTHQVDLITLDLIMPGMRGEDLLPKVQSISPHTRCIVLTADIQELTRQELMQKRADAFVHKPINPEQLRQTVRQVLQSAS